jgi:Icc-related predicted phosphoesterase
MIIDCISDLHGAQPKLEGGDLLIVAGDLTARDTEQQATKGHEEAVSVCKEQLAKERLEKLKLFQAAESEKGSPQVDLDPST